MIILTLNPGSTSIKISLFKSREKIFHKDIAGTLDDIERKITTKGYDFQKIDKFAIRVVHGGSFFTEPTKITDKSLTKLREISDLAPLHNPPAIKIIEEILVKKPDAKIWAIFDTAFHATIPDEYALYAIPRKISRDLHIRKYGFHGTANQSAIRLVEERTSQKIPAKTIICHLGGGDSVTVVKNGKSIGNSMGFTPLEGLVMVSRSGDIDAGIIEFLAKKMDLSISEVLKILNKESGILGLTGTTDLAKVFENPTNSPEYKLAFKIYLDRVEKYLYSYIARLKGLDCLIFSGGTGEHNEKIREKIREKLKKLGFTPKIHVIHVEEDVEMMQQVIKK